ncbi:transposase [Candidatus Uabimicrobium sp. HlEnr_7]|uniref:helix-turn-helix domain-containing protein n=1 Tax=Candidatus Uabimicrobium helgolandensis TaxID=3095367 RepID=UPI0035574271
MAYSQDLRTKVITAYCDKKLGSMRELSEMFSISETTVKRWVYRYQKEGSSERCPYGGGRASILNDADREVLHKLHLEKTDATLKELIKKLESKIAKTVSSSTLSRELLKLQLTRKKNV